MTLKTSAVLWLAFHLVIGVIPVQVHPAFALPIGRAWSSSTAIPVPAHHDYLGAARLLQDTNGKAFLLFAGRPSGTFADTWRTYEWGDSVWLQAAAPRNTGVGIPALVIPSPTNGLIVAPTAQDPRTLKNWLIMFEATRDSIGPPDSIFVTTTQSTEYGGARSRVRKWAVRSQNLIGETTFHVHVLYSDTVGIWHQVERLGVHEDHCTVAALGDTTAMVVYAGESGLQYAILDGSRWSETGNLDPRPFNASHPRFRIRPSGGFWLFWESHDWMHMSSYKDGVWTRGDSVQFLPNPTDNYQPAWYGVDHDTTEYPVIAWNNLGYAYTFRNSSVIMFPNEHGWDPPEEIPGTTETEWIEPTVIRDANQDTWVVWWSSQTGINWWLHTYPTATCAAPVVSAVPAGSRINWALTTPVPGSRWTIERAMADGPFDSLATVRAGADSVLSYVDPDAGAGVTWRYRIKREHVNMKYLWYSPEASYWQPDVREPLGLSLGSVSGVQLALRVAGGTGALTVRLYDLQGRVAAEHRVTASGTGDDALSLDLSTGNARHSGVYFLRVTDATGRTSRTARVAVVR